MAETEPTKVSPPSESLSEIAQTAGSIICSGEQTLSDTGNKVTQPIEEVIERREVYGRPGVISVSGIGFAPKKKRQLFTPAGQTNIDEKS